MDNKVLIEDVLNRDKNIKDILFYGEKNEIINLCKSLVFIGIDNFVTSANHIDNKFNSRDIPIFSSYEAIFDLTKLILFEEKPLIFEEIGTRLYKSKTTFAKKKYGENHSKLANDLMLVDINRGKNCFVSITNFGKMVARDEVADLNEILSIILLSNPLLQTMAHDLLKGNIKYSNYVSNLSTKSIIRRRSNVKKLFNIIYKRSKLLYNCENTVDWSV